MLKRLLIALGLCVALAALIGSGIYFTNDRLTALQQRLDQIYAVAQTDLAQAAPLCEQATQEWEASQKILCIYLSEQDLDQIGMQIARLEPLALGGDTAGFFAEHQAANLMLKNVLELETKAIG